MNSPAWRASWAVDDVAVLALARVLPWERHINFAPDGLVPSPIESSGFPPPLNTRYTCQEENIYAIRASESALDQLSSR